MKIPLCLITGFLGAGKTSLLGHLAARDASRRFAYLVNEFSDADIDAARLASISEDVVAVPGGSIFCRCLVTEFMKQLNRIRAEFKDVEGVVVEASGMADPGAIDTLLSETRLDNAFTVGNTLTVIDPGTFAKLSHTLPNINTQVAAASLIVINKCDLFDEDALDGLERDLRTLNAEAPIRRTSHGKIDDDIFVHRPDRPPSQGEYAKCRDPNYDSWIIPMPQPTPAAVVSEALEAVAPHCYRAKGHFVDGGRTYAVDMVDARLSIEPCADGVPLRLVVITRGEQPESRRQAFQQELSTPRP